MKTFIGNFTAFLAVVVWAATLAFVVQCGNVAPLLLVGLASVICAALQGAGEWMRGERDFRAPASACLFEAVGVTGYRVLAFPPLMLIDPVEAANLIHVWVPAAIMFGLGMMGARPGPRQALGGLCVAAGVWWAVYDGFGAWHVLALVGALVGGWHVAKSAYFKGAGAKASVIGNMAGGLVLLLLSFIGGESWAMSLSDLAWLAGLVIVSNAGWLLWMEGAKHGQVRAAKVSVLLKPAAAVGWIWLLCGAPLTAAHVASLFAVTMAGLILSPHVFRSARTARFS